MKKLFVYKVLLFIIFSQLWSCSSSNTSEDKPEIKTAFENKLTLKANDSIFFPIDSTTTPFTPRIQLYEDRSGVRYLTMLNQRTNSIYIYDYDKRKILKRVPFKLEGPLGVGPLEGYEIHNFDTILLNSRYKMFLADTSGKPYYQFDFFKDRDPESVSGLLTSETKRPAVYKDGKIYFDILPDIAMNDMDAIEEAKLKFILDVKTRKVRADLVYPKNYSEGYFPIHYLMGQGSTYNSKTDRFVYSFPASNLLVETDHQSFYKEHFGGSECCLEIPYMAKKDPTSKEYHKHFFTNPYYDMIYYDKYRDLYYSMIFTGVTDDQFNNRDWKRGILIMIFDSNFNKVGEVLFDRELQYNSWFLFVTSEGLLMQRASDNEDSVRLIQFSIESITK